MAKFVVSYDVPEGGDYTELYELLKRLKAVRALKSTVLIAYGGTAKKLFQELAAAAPTKTKLLITPHSQGDDWEATANLGDACSSWLNT